jgi:hypothetical protein
VRTVLTRLKLPLLFSALMALPWLILEWVNRRAYAEPFPLALFIFLGLLPLLFAFILQSLAGQLRAGGATRQPVRLLLGLTALILIAWVWLQVLRDQLPCFLGILACD